MVRCAVGDYVADALHDATLCQINTELQSRYPHVVLGILRPDAKTGRSIFTNARYGSLVEQLGIVEALRLGIVNDLTDSEDEDMDEGN